MTIVKECLTKHLKPEVDLNVTHKSVLFTFRIYLESTSQFMVIQFFSDGF